MIAPEHFVSEMEARWTMQLGNVSSPALRRVWKQIAQTFSTHIASHGKAEGRQWHILQPPTGSGKSQGTVVYCAMLSRPEYVPEDQHPGALIVTRLIADADLIAEQINALAGRSVAVAYHSDSKDRVNIGELSDWPVVVITHRAYELALDVLGKHGDIPGTWAWFHDWEGDTRKLVVIDESLDIVEHSQAGLDGLRQTQGSIPTRILSREDCREAAHALKRAIEWLEQMQELSTNRPALNHEKMMPNGAEVEQRIREAVRGTGFEHTWSVPDMTPLREALKDIQFHPDDARRDNERRKHDARLRSLHYIFRSWSYYAANHADGNHTLNTARLLVPEDVKGAVVLDATARSNVLYEVFNEATVLTPPPDSRNYRNVTMHVSRGHKTGKRWMGNNAKKLAGELMADLRERFGPDRRVFIVTHKFVEPYLQGFKLPFQYTTGHWGAVDGSNQWRDCDTVVVFGLHRRPNTWPVNVYMAAQGPQTTDWLRDAGLRQFGRYQDIRRSLETGQIIVDTVQAINRIRCRKVTDAEGNCPTADVYILLPDDTQGREIQAGIEREMPGLVVAEDWHISAAKRKVRRSSYEEPLLTWLRGAGRGCWSAPKLRNTLGIPQRAWMRLMADLRNTKSVLFKAMTEAGFRYTVNGSGRGARSYFESF